MAFLYTRDRSPFWWIGFKDEFGKTQQVSTKCRRGVGPDERRARQMEAEKTLAELSHTTSRDGVDKWINWVPEFFAITYAAKTITREKYLSSWATIQMFLKERSIERPNQLRRQHCFEFMTWRQKPKRERGKYRVCHNTALLDLRILRIVMNEAVERGYCSGNPCVRLKIRKQKPKRKPELTDAHIELIRASIAKITNPSKREFFSNSFEIARYQGCRISETLVNPMTDVNIVETAGQKIASIRFNAKGNKEYTVTLHPKLIPLFEKLQSDKRTTTWTGPAGFRRQWPSVQWTRFFKRTGLKKILENICFHCTRVTVVTRLTRNDVPISKAMEYVKHASTTVHYSYQRLKIEDLSGCIDAVGD